MGSLEHRLDDLERRILQNADPEPSESYKRLRICLDELAALKSSCAVHERGGVRVEPENIPRQLLGPHYTHGDLLALAVERASATGAFPLEDVPRLTAYMRPVYAKSKDPDAGVEWERGYGD